MEEKIEEMEEQGRRLAQLGHIRGARDVQRTAPLAHHLLISKSGWRQTNHPPKMLRPRMSRATSLQLEKNTSTAESAAATKTALVPTKAADFSRARG